MTAKSLAQYFRSFLVKLCMIEASLGQMELGGVLVLAKGLLFSDNKDVIDDVSFAILLELEDQAAPSASQTKVGLAQSSTSARANHSGRTLLHGFRPTLNIRPPVLLKKQSFI